MIYTCKDCGSENIRLYQIIRIQKRQGSEENVTRIYPDKLKNYKLETNNTKTKLFIKEENNIPKYDGYEYNRIHRSQWIQCDDCGYKKYNHIPEIKFIDHN